MMSRTKKRPKVAKIWIQRGLRRGYCKVGSADSIKVLDRFIMTKRKTETMITVMAWLSATSPSIQMLMESKIHLKYVPGEEDELRGTERKHALVTGNFGRCTTGNEPFTTDLHEDWGSV
jgi:hypothetical protein